MMPVSDLQPQNSPFKSDTEQLFYVKEDVEIKDFNSFAHEEIVLSEQSNPLKGERQFYP